MIRLPLTAAEFRPDLSQPKLPSSLLGVLRSCTHKLEEIAYVLDKSEGRLHGEYLCPCAILSNGDTQV